MLTNTIKELEAYRAKVQELEQKVIAERPSELAALPAKFGFTDVNDFVEAVKEAVAMTAPKSKIARKPAKQAPAKKEVEAEVTEKKERTRAKVTPELKEQIIAAVNAGKTGKAIAEEFGVSLPTVQNIKKAAGLVKARTEETAPAAPVETPAETSAPAPAPEAPVA